MRFEKFQNIRTNVGLHRLPPVRVNRLDTVLPRPSPVLFRWHLKYHHEDRIHSPIAAPLGGPGSGGLYRPLTSPYLSERVPPRVVWRNDRWEFMCRLAGRETGCDRSFVNGIAEQKHIMDDHLSPNDDPTLFRGETFLPRTWYAFGRITSVADRQRQLGQVPAYRQMVRSRAGSRTYARGLARKLA